jgi:hypothetical protein
MPYILCILLLLTQTLSSQAQCKDVYGDKTECPSDQDSLVIYNNAIRVVEFYNNNKSYQLLSSLELTENRQKVSVFEDLKEARRMFNILRRELESIKDDKFSAGKPKPGYKDINYSQYYQFVDENRFYQRELENQIVNSEAPMSMYDLRISPVLVNAYKCIDTSSIYFNDLVNIPLYVPVIVKPFALLTETELIMRYKALHITPVFPSIPKRQVEKRDSTNTIVVKKVINNIPKDTIIHVNNFYAIKPNNLPIYAFNGYGSGGVIGFMVGRKFKKLTKKEYSEYAVPLFARELLANEKELDKYLKIKFGAYYEGFY